MLRGESRVFSSLTLALPSSLSLSLSLIHSLTHTHLAKPTKKLVGVCRTQAALWQEQREGKLKRAVLLALQQITQRPMLAAATAASQRLLRRAWRGFKVGVGVAGAARKMRLALDTLVARKRGIKAVWLWRSWSAKRGVEAGSLAGEFFHLNLSYELLYSLSLSLSLSLTVCVCV